MTAIYYPEGITAQDLLPKIDARGVVVAGGLMPGQDAKYFRVGHMGLSVVNEELKHVEDTATAIWEALQECGFQG
jgi:alanine-glyoxylate transaminase/serine-glyoxylate transaminase/serine-pyruvate transaminase